MNNVSSYPSWTWIDRGMSQHRLLLLVEQTWRHHEKCCSIQQRLILREQHVYRRMKSNLSLTSLRPWQRHRQPFSFLILRQTLSYKLHVCSMVFENRDIVCIPSKWRWVKYNNERKSNTNKLIYIYHFNSRSVNDVWAMIMLLVGFDEEKNQRMRMREQNHGQQHQHQEEEKS